MQITCNSDIYVKQTNETFRKTKQTTVNKAKLHLLDLSYSKLYNKIHNESRCLQQVQNNHHHNRFMALYPGPPGLAGTRRELLDCMVQGKIIRDRHTDYQAGRHSIRTNQCPSPSSPYVFLQAGCPSCRPTNSVKALKAKQVHNKSITNQTVVQQLHNIPQIATARCITNPQLIEQAEFCLYTAALHTTNGKEI